NLMDIIDIKIKDQFDQIHDAKAQLKKNLVEHENEPLKLSQRIQTKTDINAKVKFSKTENFEKRKITWDYRKHSIF
ncbi:hypothetical protein ECE15_15530, partial [Acinetobacter baumannii]|nr:hypothetical protein [Acinetobacter baumannii]